MIDAGWSRLRRFWRPSVREEIDDELAFHFAMRVDEFVASGMPLADAEQRARELFGDVHQVTERLRSMDTRRRWKFDGRELIAGTWSDVRHAARSLRHDWIVALIAIVTLSLGIGASTAVFSVVEAVLLRPLPYGAPDRLAFIADDLAGSSGDHRVSGAQFQALVTQVPTTLDGIAGVTAMHNVPFGMADAEPEATVYAAVTPTLFDVLRVPIVRGRNFNANDGTPNDIVEAPPDDRAGPASFRLPRIGMISYEYWQRRFHGDPSIVGKSLVGPWGPMEIVGVVGPRVELLFPNDMHVDRAPDIWEASRRNFTKTPGTSPFHVIARVRAGVSMESANAQVAGIPGAAGASLRLEPMKPYLVKDVQPALLAAMGAVGFVLLIACANVASLMLIRAANRDRELAVRAAIGGSPWRLLRQLFGESVLLAGVAAMIGVGLADVGIVLLVRLAPSNLPRLDRVSIDAPVLAFSIAATFVATLLFGLLPALRASRPRVADLLRGGTKGRRIGGGIGLRSSVVIAEVALSLVLLVGCGLMVRTFTTLIRRDLGFDPANVLTFAISNRNFRLPEDRAAFNREVHEKLGAVRGVRGIVIAGSLPLAADGNANQYPLTRFARLSAPNAPPEFHQIPYAPADPEYFSLLRTPLLAGRIYGASTPRDSMVIDDVMAREAFGDVSSAVGQRLLVGSNADTMTVIGVVRHQRQASLIGDERGMLFISFNALHPAGGRWAVRIDGDTSLIVPNLRAALATVRTDYISNTRAEAPGSTKLIVNSFEPLQRFVDDALAPTRFALVLITIFAIIAALLAAVGLYGVVSTAARQRTSEIGVRLAFGAESRDIFALIVGHGMRLSLAGVAIGIAIAIVATRQLSALLVEVRPTDPPTFVVMGVLLLAIALVACWIPARRAAALDPNAALREDH